jgi:MFS family permease
VLVPRAEVHYLIADLGGGSTDDDGSVAEVRKTAALRVAGVLAMIAAEAFLYGFTYPWFTLALEERGVATWAIGLNASLAGAGILFVGPFLPALIDRVGLKPLVAGQFGLSLACFAALLSTDDLLVWFLARFVMGTCFASLWTTTEIWLNGVAPAAHRGRIIGASGTLYATFQFLGPLALGATGASGILPVIAGMVPLAVGLALALSVPVAVGEVEEEEPDGTLSGLMAALPIAGALIAAAFITGIGETAMQSLLPLYGLSHGFDVAGSSTLVAVFSLGEAVLVALLGWMADRFGRRTTLIATTGMAAATSLLIPLAASSWVLLWPVLFVAGGTVAGLYTLGVVLIGQDFRGQRLAIVSTGFAMAYSAGAVIGATPVAALMAAAGDEALPVGIGMLFLGLFAALSLRRPRRTSAGEPWVSPGARERPRRRHLRLRRWRKRPRSYWSGPSSDPPPPARAEGRRSGRSRSRRR